MRHEEGDKETKTYWKPILDQGLVVGLVIHFLQMRTLKFRKTSALDNVFKMVAATIGHPKC